MGTQKKESSSLRTVLILTVVFVILSATCAVTGNNSSPTNILIDSYSINDKTLPSELEKIASNLKRTLKACENSELAFRIKYRIGILQYKAGKLSDACVGFEQTASEANCPLPVRISSLNMAGQIHRLSGQTKRSLESFDRLLKTTEKCLAAKSDEVSPAILKLAALAAFGRAEVYQQQEDYKPARQEYKKLINILQHTEQEEFDGYKAIAKDRLSQMYLMDGDSTNYLDVSRDIVKSHPKYFRIALIEFEIVALELLLQANADTKFPRGSFDVPAKLITYAKDNPKDKKIAGVMSWLKKYNTNHENNYSTTLLNYHFAWLLDITGKHKEAAEIFDRISQANSINNIKPEFLIPLLKDLSNYACLQRATILGEIGEYNAAIKSAQSISDNINNAHLSGLTESITEGLAILKREVPKNESK